MHPHSFCTGCLTSTHLPIRRLCYRYFGASIPQQKDGAQCGIFTLAYAQMLVMGKPVHADSFQHEDSPQLRQQIKNNLETGKLIWRSPRRKRALPAAALPLEIDAGASNAHSLLEVQQGTDAAATPAVSQSGQLFKCSFEAWALFSTAQQLQAII